MKDQALWIYQQITARRRHVLRRRLSCHGQMPVGILFYHRVADRHPNAWTLSRSDFCRQLDWLQANYDIVTLHEAQRRIRGERCHRPTVSITFDDGYAENADFAIPELSRRNLPATYFVATDFVRSGRPFPHDVQAGCPLAPNTIQEIRDFASLGMEIGAHTKGHVDLGRIHCAQEVRSEIFGSLQQLRDWLGSEIRYFALPFGKPENVTQLAVDCLVEAGVLGFCSAYGAWNWPNTSGFHLRRIHADPGLQSLKNWLTLDSRKLVERHPLPIVEPEIDHRNLNIHKSSCSR